jgi:hypothetical protein
MAIKNYTSQVAVSRSVTHIQDRLVACGAKSIVTEYKDKTLSSLAFTIQVDGREIPFRLPSRVDRVEKRLQALTRRPRTGTLEKIQQQAARTAWRILSDWVDIQMSLIELDQAEFMEIFLPYVFDPASNQTFFEKAKGAGFKMLGYSPPKE